MDPHDFFTLLLRAKGMTATSLARAIGLPKSQGTISKFENGDVKAPRGAWVARAVEHLQIDPAALQYPAVASREAARLGLSSERTPDAELRFAPKVKQARIDAGMLVLQIADLMRGYSEARRKLAAPLFHGAAENPEQAPKIADAVRALLADDGNRGSLAA